MSRLTRSRLMSDRPSASHDATMVLDDPDPRASSSARRWASRFCHEIGVPSSADEDLGLILSELVENARIHAGGPIEVRLRRLGDALRAEVTDPSDDLPETPATPGAQPGGRGITIVAAVARSWGFDLRDGAKTVWAEIGLEDDSPGPPAPGRSGAFSPRPPGRI